MWETEETDETEHWQENEDEEGWTVVTRKEEKTNPLLSSLVTSPELSTELSREELQPQIFNIGILQLSQTLSGDN